MKTRFIVVGLILLGFASQVFAQDKRHPMDVAKGYSEKTSQRCAVLDVGELYFSSDTYEVDIYEAGQNIRISKNSFGTEGREKVYLYEPRYQIRSINGKPAVKLDRTSSPPRITLELEPKIPDRMDLILFIQNNKDPYVQPGNVRPLCIFGYEVSYPNATTYRQDRSAGVNLDDILVAHLEFPNGGVQSAYQNILTGASVTLSYAVNLKLSQRHAFEITKSDIVNSEVYRNFFSPVQGQLIWALQARIGTAAMHRELDARVIIEGRNELLERTFFDLWNQVIDVSEKHIISFKELADGAGAAKHLTDFANDLRFRTDVVRHIAEDAKKLSNREWCNKYHNELRSVLDKSRKSDRDGKGSFDVFNIFSLGGGGGSKVDDQFHNEWSSLANSEDCGKQNFEDTFSYEWDGERYIPKGIIAYEVIKSSSKAIDESVVSLYYYDQDLRVRTREVRLEAKP